MCASAIALRPQLLLRARALCGVRADVDAEDLVSVALLALVAKPPNPKNPTQLHRWLRTVLRNLAARRTREFHGAIVVSLEGMQQSRHRSVEE